MNHFSFSSVNELVLKAKKHKLVSLLVVALVIYLVYDLFFKAATNTVTLQYVKAKRGDLQTIVSGTGQVSPTSQVDLKPKVNASVIAVLVASGDKVRQGQILFRLDARDAYKQLRDAQLSLDQAQLALDKLKQPAQTIDVLSLEDSIKKAEASKAIQDTAVATAYNNLLNSNIIATPEVDYTTETAPTISGSYLKGEEGQIKVYVYSSGTGGSFSLSGLVTGSGKINTVVPQPLGDTGLFIKFNSTYSQTNWIINIPNKQSSSYLSAYNTYQNAVNTRDSSNADSDRSIAEYKQKLADLQKGTLDIDLKAQGLAVQQRQNALMDAQTTLADYTITAPFDGTMASVSGQVGLSAVVASAQSGTSLGTIITDKKIAQITLNEADIAKVKIGQPVNLTFDAIDGLIATGTVAEIDGLGVVTSGVVTYKLQLLFSSDDARIKPSMSVSADIITDSKQNVLLIPNQALKQDADGYYVETDSVATSSFSRGTRNASSTSAFASSTRRLSSSSTRVRGSGNYGKSATNTTTQSDTTLTRIPVTIGSQNDTQTEITSGLVEGQQIVIKKTTGTTTAKVPSVTSLFSPARGSGGGGARSN